MNKKCVIHEWKIDEVVNVYHIKATNFNEIVEVRVCDCICKKCFSKKRLELIK